MRVPVELVLLPRAGCRFAGDGFVRQQGHNHPHLTVVGEANHDVVQVRRAEGSPWLNSWW